MVASNGKRIEWLMVGVPTIVLSFAYELSDYAILGLSSKCNIIPYVGLMLWCVKKLGFDYDFAWNNVCGVLLNVILFN